MAKKSENIDVNVVGMVNGCIVSGLLGLLCPHSIFCSPLFKGFFFVYLFFLIPTL